MKTLKGIEVFAVGKWNGMAFQAHDLAAMAEAYAALRDVHKVPVKLGHNAEQPFTDGKPALGWVDALYVRGDKLVADLVDVPDVVAKAIKNRLYRRVSIELSIDVKYQGKHIPFVVDAVALLGADLPAVNVLEDLNAYMSRDAAQFSFARQEKFSAVAGSITEGRNDMNEEEVKKVVDAAVGPLKVEFGKLQARNTELETEKKTLADANTALTQQVATFKANEAKAKIDAKRTRAKAVLEGLTASGIILPAAREAFSKALGIEDDKKLESLDIEAFVEGLGVKEKVDPATGKSAFTKPGAGDADKPANDGEKFETFEAVSEALDKRTRELMSEKKLTYTVAKQEVLAGDENLAAAYAAGPA